MLLIAFSWIAYAYIAGSRSSTLLAHPIVAILLTYALQRTKATGHLSQAFNLGLTLIGIWLLVRLIHVFMPFIIGFSLAYIVDSALEGLRTIPLTRHRKLVLSRAHASLIFVLIVVILLTFIGLGVVPQIIEQGTAMKDGLLSLYRSLNDLASRVSEDISNGEYPLKYYLPETWREPVGEAITNLVSDLQQKLPSIAQSVSEIMINIVERLSAGVYSTLGRISTAFFVVIIFVYLIQAFKPTINKITGLLPEQKRYILALYAKEIDKDMKAFLRGQLLVILIVSVIYMIAYAIIRVPFALLMGILSGLCNAIPTVGPILGGLIAFLSVLTGLAAKSYGLNGFLIRAVLVIGASFGVQMVDNSLISPKVMSKAIEVHPLVILFAVLLFASILGIWGAVLAIPGVIIVKAVINVSRRLSDERQVTDKSTDSVIQQ